MILPKSNLHTIGMFEWAISVSVSTTLSSKCEFKPLQNEVISKLKRLNQWLDVNHLWILDETGPSHPKPEAIVLTSTCFQQQNAEHFGKSWHSDSSMRSDLMSPKLSFCTHCTKRITDDIKGKKVAKLVHRTEWLYHIGFHQWIWNVLENHCSR